MVSLVDAPHLVSALARCFAVNGGLEPSVNVVQRLAYAAYGILLGLDEVTDRFQGYCGTAQISPPCLTMSIHCYDDRVSVVCDPQVDVLDVEEHMRSSFNKQRQEQVLGV